MISIAAERSTELLPLRVRLRGVRTIDEERERRDHQQRGQIHLTNQEICPKNRSHPFRHDLPQAVAHASGEKDRLAFKGSAGQGNWVKGPWVAVFNTIVTDTAQRGYYPVYLFREDMRGVYLSLNQGMTEARRDYKADAKTALRARASNFRAMLGDRMFHFSASDIDLAPSSASNDTAFYEAGNVCAAFYAASAMPSEEILIEDLRSMLSLYEALIVGETDSEAVLLDQEEDAPADLDFEDARRFRMHKRIERRASLVKKVKKLRGYVCEVCTINFTKVYGAIGAGYIEAHHRKPLATLKGTRVSIDPAKDFAVLCANCHRMVHRSGLVDDIDRFRREHFYG